MQFSILEQGKKKKDVLSRPFLFPKYTDKHAMKDILFVCFNFFFLIMDFCHSEEKLVFIFEVLNLEKLFKVFSIC